MASKILYIPIFFIALLACNGSNKKQSVTQQAPTKNLAEHLAKDNDKKIDSLSQVPVAYQNIIKLIGSSAVDSASFNYNCAGEKAGKIIYYRKNGKLVLIEKIYGEYSHTEGKDQYFLSDGKPFFIYQKVTNWAFDSNSGTQGATIDKVTEKRFYIVKNQLLKCLQKQYEISSSAKGSFRPDKIKNTEVDCPPLDKLLKDYNILLAHQNQVTDIECL